MSVSVLGVSAFYHDAAAALIVDGTIVAAAQEERFSRRKGDRSLPTQAIDYCLGEAGIEPADLDGVAFYDNPLLTWDRIVRSCHTVGAESRGQFQRAARSVLGTNVWVQSLLHEALGSLGRAGRLFVVDHHVSHAASAFYPSPFARAAVVTLDGVGEWETTTVGAGDEHGIALRQAIDYPHSLGLLYSTFTQLCGFEVNFGEYKLMGLAPYGSPTYAQTIYDELIAVAEDGSYRLNLEYLGYVSGPTMVNERFEQLFGGPARQPQDPIRRRDLDAAASIQVVLEEVVRRIVTHARRDTGLTDLVLAGGVALNCVANGKLHRERIFDRLWIQPAAGDAGGALGAALTVAHEHFGVPRRGEIGRMAARDGQRGSLLGPRFSSAEVRAFLDRYDVPYHVVDAAERADVIAGALAEGAIVGHLAGRMEFGPRALGARSILADPRGARMQSTINLRVKRRESFRPLAPAVLHDRVSDYFDLAGESPYMLLVAPVRPDRRRTVDAPPPDPEDLMTRLGQPRSELPAVTHVDDSARIQTVHPDDNPELHAILDAFARQTACPVLLNTSFNLRNEPIVCTPRDAYTCFIEAGLDLLVLEDCFVWKRDNPPRPRSSAGAAPASGAAVECPSDEAVDGLFDQLLACERLTRQPFDDAPFGVRRESYYRERARPDRSADRRFCVDYSDADGLAAALRALWADEPALAALADTHARAAASLARTGRTDRDDVPSFIYAMF